MSRSGIRAARAPCGGRREQEERTEILKITRPDPERTPPRGARADRPCMATGCGTQRPPTVRHGVIACAQRGARGVQSILGHGWGGRGPALLPGRDLPYRLVCHPVSCRWGTPARQRQVVRGMCPHAVAWPEKRPVSVCRACMMHAGWRKSCLLASCRFGHARKAAGPGVVHHGWAAWRNESIPARGACVYPADGWPVR